MSALPNDIIYEKDFWKDVRDLPKKVQDKLAGLVEILRKNPFDPRLHTKRLGPPLHNAFFSYQPRLARWFYVYWFQWDKTSCCR